MSKHQVRVCARWGFAGPAGADAVPRSTTAFSRSDHHDDLLNYCVSDRSQAGTDPARMARPVLLVSSAKSTESAPELKHLLLSQAVDPAERVSEGDSLHAVGVRR